ncbi:putative glycosyltransferase [Calothrix sp. NIES-4071]|nr:putative glycosyltransferase [Calothrix sp. NIES-4071]BAZ58780.1 putative glycosyltransferase [Calothrix sp. NIES-4105]
MSSILHPLVTIIVVPRERFSYTRESLTSIYTNTNYPFELIYIDAGSPPHIKNYLASEAENKKFQLIRKNYYLSPNHARNLGLQQATTQYVVFIDNDVIVSPGWLQSLIQSADETGATVVSPLICQGTPLHSEIHCAGGETGILEETKNGITHRRRIIEKINLQGKKLALNHIERQPTKLAEFHCVLVRQNIFTSIGYLDENLLNTKEHVDLCMLVQNANGSIYLEPKSIVTYVPTTSLELTDIPYYMLRWSDAWEKASLQHLCQKWNLTKDEYFKNRYKRLGWRRNMTIINPISSKIPSRIGAKITNKLLRLIDKPINKLLTNHYIKKHQHT